MRLFSLITPFAAVLSGLLLAVAPLNAAEPRTFPYEAVVSAELLYVRSGPGPKYYPTSKLRKGDRVLVQRHDPGGWFMIVPPPGSFSWIPSRYVKRIDNERGAVTTNNVVVRVGSFESDNTRDLFQRKLSEGDEVRILEEKVLQGDGGKSEAWFRIEPPKGEWRWVMGKHVAVVAPGADPSAGRDDPFSDRVGDQVPASKPATKPRTSLKPSSTRPVRSTTSLVSAEYDPDAHVSTAQGTQEPPERNLSKKQKQTAMDLEEEELMRLDNRLQGIFELPPLDWDFEPVVQDYKSLRERTKQETLQWMIDRRFELIEQKLRIKAQHLAIQKLGEETLRRDAELAAEQREHESRILGGPQKAPSQFDGAGIVQRSATNLPLAPRYALVAPNGRVLAYLQPGSGVNLEPWVGRAAGIYGTRAYRQELKADLLVVSTLTPVRLGQ